MATIARDLDAHVFLERYRKGEWRDRIFRDMIFRDARPQGRHLTFLDIGCGGGFDGDGRLQASIAEVAGSFIGIEPDQSVVPGACFDAVHRCRLEDAPLEPASVDVAYAIMVLEHLAEPLPFWDAVWNVLRPGGVFWGLTVDRRHWFCRCSLVMEKLRLKEIYLRWLLGRRGEDRYENYPVHYRSNSPQQIESYTQRFRRRDFINFARAGQCNAYFPAVVRPFVTAWDARRAGVGRPGVLLAVRVEK